MAAAQSCVAAAYPSSCASNPSVSWFSCWNVPVTQGHAGWTSDWIVLQATWYSDLGSHELQPTALRIEADWTEIVLLA